MGDFGRLATECRQAAAVLEQATPSVVSHGAVIIKESLQAGLSARAGGDMVLDKGGGAPVNVRYRMSGQGPVHQAVIRPNGAAVYWVERGTAEHEIKPRRKKALAFGNRSDDDDTVRTPVGHQGARARPFWRQRTAAAVPQAEQAMRDDYQKLLEGVFT